MTQSNIYQKKLTGGTLTVTPTNIDIPLDELFDIAERQNPKRAFLFVSKVLGKHIPIAPKTMRNTFQVLAEKFPSNLPEPVLYIGMAETAVGLGAGVFDEAKKQHEQSIYLTSTRHPVDGELLCEFKENHSHATDHLIYYPNDPILKQRVKEARSLVFIDDEATTGNTFVNLFNALREDGRFSELEEIVTVTLTDWSGDAIKTQNALPTTDISLAKGNWNWERDINAPIPVMPAVNVTAKGAVSISQQQGWGRLGMTESAKNLGQNITVRTNENVLVLGTSEFVWEPYLLAERLEREGANVKFSSTTRSPISIGHAIKSATSFADNYGLGIPNFLYNVTHQQFDRIIICVETPVDSVDPTLLESLSITAPMIEVITHD